MIENESKVPDLNSREREILSERCIPSQYLKNFYLFIICKIQNHIN